MEIRIPEIGESIFEATVAKWHKQDGEKVGKDDVLCELETDKITLELHAESDGTLKIETGEGQTVQVGSVIGRLEGATSSPAEASAPEAEKPAQAPTEAKPEKKETPAPPAATIAAEPKPAEPKPAEPKPAEPKPAEPKPAEPKPAAERVPETGPASTTAAPKSDDRLTRTPMSSIRKKIAARLLAARNQTAMLTTFNEADMSRVQELRKKQQETFQKRHGVKLGLMSFFVKACVEALKDFPDVNSRIEGDDILTPRDCHIGIAIGAEKGLVVPVLKDAEPLNFAEIEQAIAAFVEKSAANRLELGDLEGGTFTITNGGIYGSMLSTPLLNYPQSAILGMHSIQERAMVRNGEVVVRPMMYLALSYDHRLIDGRQAVEFLKRVKEFIEEPEEMLLEM